MSGREVLLQHSADGIFSCYNILMEHYTYICSLDKGEEMKCSGNYNIICKDGTFDISETWNKFSLEVRSMNLSGCCLPNNVVKISRAVMMM